VIKAIILARSQGKFMWSLFFRGAPAAPTPLSPEQKAAAAFNELSAYC
jgi:hypothetical protein